MISLKNAAATSSWFIDLKEYPQVENILPLNGFNLRNDSNIVAYVDLEGVKVGEVQRYSADTLNGREYELIKVYNPDGQDFAPGDLFIQATKGENMTSQPFNPQWDMMFDDLNRFSTGTDHRMSLSDTMTADRIKYWINTQNGVIVQRRLDIQAHATLLGNYKIIFSDDDILSGAVGIGVPPPPDTLLHKKSIINSVFDYETTNATIVGWILDYLFNPNDVSDNYAVVVGGANVGNTYDDDMDTYAAYSEFGVGYVTKVEFSFASTSIEVLHSYLSLDSTGGSGSNCIIQLYSDGGWVTVTTSNTTDADLKTFYNHDAGSWPNCTGLRMRLQDNGGSTASMKVYDITALRV